MRLWWRTMILWAVWLMPFLAAGQDSLPATVVVDASKVEGTISPLLYGQFIEFMYEGIKGGLHAELIRDRGFEQPPNHLGLPRYWERYPDDRNDDYGMKFSCDGALRVTLTKGVIPRRGIYQSRMPLRSGMEYRGYVWAKGSNFTGQIRVALEQDITEGEIYAEAELGPVGGDWARLDFTLRTAKADALARFAILFEGRGVIWIDNVSLIPGDAVDDLRADVFEKVKALRPAFIRWPGGNVAQDYHWKWGIGPRETRTTWTNLSWNNEPEPSDFGTDEFLRFCRRLGAEPSITVNVGGLGATADEAAAWVKYCNRRVRLWEVGNEIWGDWVRGHSDAATYASNLNRYAAAMRAVDPAIELIAVGDNDTNWNATVLRLAGSQIDYLAIHHYYMENEMDGDLLNLMARPLHYERFYGEMRRWLRALAPQRRIRLAINEWGLGVPVSRQHSMQAALYAARLMNVFERNGDLIALSAVSDLINGWPGGIIQASRHGVFVTPAYHVNRLYREYQGTERLAVTVESPAFDSSREGKGVPYLDVVGSRNTNQLVLKAVNTHPTHTLDVEVQVRGREVGPRGRMFLLKADTPDASNSFRNPDAVTVRTSEITAGPRFQLSLPRQSVAVVVLN